MAGISYTRDKGDDMNCKTDGCTTPVRRKGWCNPHYQHWYKYGTADEPRPARPACEVEGCDSEARSSSARLCERHYGWIRRNGSLTLQDRYAPFVTYRAAHSRLTRDIGKASTHPCVDCDATAHHWSYMHTDPNELVSEGGQPYSLNPDCYEPRCAPCHALFDGTGTNQYAA